jgi:hypothetical protein
MPAIDTGRENRLIFVSETDAGANTGTVRELEYGEDQIDDTFESLGIPNRFGALALPQTIKGRRRIGGSVGNFDVRPAMTGLFLKTLLKNATTTAPTAPAVLYTHTWDDLSAAFSDKYSTPPLAMYTYRSGELKRMGAGQVGGFSLIQENNAFLKGGLNNLQFGVITPYAGSAAVTLPTPISMELAEPFHYRDFSATWRPENTGTVQSLKVERCEIQMTRQTVPDEILGTDDVDGYANGDEGFRCNVNLRLSRRENGFRLYAEQYKWGVLTLKWEKADGTLLQVKINRAQFRGFRDNQQNFGAIPKEPSFASEISNAAGKGLDITLKNLVTAY